MIPGIGRAPTAGPLVGAWGGYITNMDTTGYTVSCPDLIGRGKQPGCEAVPGTWVVGDPVWVMAINGNRSRLLIFAHRQRDPAG